MGLATASAAGHWLKRAAKRRNRAADVTVSVALPWLVFFLVTCLFLFVYQELRVAVWVLVGLCVCLALLFLLLGACGRHPALAIIGLMCLSSASSAATVGVWLHGRYLERYWQLERGSAYRDVDPAADPRKTADAGVITFAAGAFVDDGRTLGYVADGGIFCVAPVAAPPYYSGTVSYWAVGLDCCQPRSGFDCGSSRELGAVSALPEPASEQYGEAIAAAAAVYGLRSAAGAQLVSFVDDPQQAIVNTWDETVAIALVAMLVDLVACGLAGAAIAKLLSPPQKGSSEKTPLRK